MEFSNVYEDDQRAEAYSKLEFPGTYYLAFRDLPTIVSEHAQGKKALDFGCGSGRSTRFLRKLGYFVTGIDISSEMVRRAKEQDPNGDYRVIKAGDFSDLDEASFDLILAAFPFDNIPTIEDKVMNLEGLGKLLKETGILINLVSSPEIYHHEWASFSTKDFPQNLDAQNGDIVQIIQCDISDRRPVEDIIWMPDAYLETYHRSNLEIVQTYRPLGRVHEPFEWVNETKIPPWVIYVLKQRAPY